ncbi:MAG: Gfo/Idh/MocA family oxidoreductase [Bacteroidota bacterium]|nr:Gfo/Idh/MocA family oxidoreductase [Bacteroidota bacterium]
MSTKRRDFLKITGLTGVSFLGSSLFANAAKLSSDLESPAHSGIERFNMCGYAAPKLEKVRVGFIGLGMRGPTHVYGFSKIEGVEIKGLCDIRPEKVAAMEKKLSGTSHKPDSYTGDENSWKKMCDRKDIDLVIIATPWALHTPMAVYAMKAGKHVAIEVPAAKTLDQCWQLVHTSESTKKHCMMMENCCYDFFELMTLNMARDGFFGEVLHGEGAYLHNLLGENFDKNGYYNMWRLRENIDRNGNLYPTHGLGPLCQIMNINRGDQFVDISSTSSNDFLMHKTAMELAAKDPFYKEFENKKFRGNMNATNIRTQNGKTLTIYHDVTTPRPYSRIHLLNGTKASAVKYPEPAKISLGEDWIDESGMKKLEEKYTPEIVQKVGSMAKKIGGHGGMDFMMQWRLIDCLRNGLPLDEDVYDAALWSSITPLSEWSVAHDSNSVKAIDFTAGAWKTNRPVELTLKGGGTTEVVPGK